MIDDELRSLYDDTIRRARLRFANGGPSGDTFGEALRAVFEAGARTQRERVQALEDALNRHQAAFIGRRPSAEHMDADEYRENHCAAFMHAADVLRATPLAKVEG